MAFDSSLWGRGVLLTGLSPISTLSGFVALITLDNIPVEAIDAGSNSALNGGGDIRFSTDIGGNNQLPLEVVSFVTSATPANRSCRLWVRFPAYAFGSTDVYMFYNRSGQTQPIVTDSFGRNSVWPSRFGSYRLSESSGSVALDSSGNNDGTYLGGLPDQGADFGQDFDGSGDSISLGADIFDNSSFTISVKLKPDAVSSNSQILSRDSSSGSNRYFQFRVDAGGKVRIICWDSSNSIFINTPTSSSLSAGTECIIHFSFDGSSYRVYIDGTLDLSISNSTLLKNSVSSQALRVGSSKDGSSEEFNGQIIDIDILEGEFKSDSYISSEQSNQSSPSAFWVTGAPFSISSSTAGTISQDDSAFTQGASGTSVYSHSGTASQIDSGFSQYLVGDNAPQGVAGSVSQALSSFTQSALSEVVSNDTVGYIGQDLTGFSQSANAESTLNIFGGIETSIDSFSQNAVTSLVTPVTGIIAQVDSGFTQSLVGGVPTPINRKKIKRIVGQSIKSFKVRPSTRQTFKVR